MNEHNIRTLLAAIIIFIAATASAADAVQQIYKHPFTGDLYGLPELADTEGNLPTVHLSSNNGQTWMRFSTVTSMQAEALVTTAFAVIPDAGGNDVIFAGTASDGLFRSTDAGLRWVQWNDASIGVEQIIASDTAGDPAWALTADGAILVTNDNGDNWTLISAAAAFDVTVLAHAEGNDVYAGTSNGHIIWVADGGSATSVLTNTALPGSVRHLAKSSQTDLFASVSHSDASGNRMYRGSGANNDTWEEILVDGEIADLRGLTTLGSTVYALEIRENAQVFEPGEPQDLITSDDNGATWSGVGELFPFIVIVNQLYVAACNETDCEPYIYVAHDEGLAMKARQGLGWNFLGGVVQPPPQPEPPPPPPSENADLSIEMVSPVWETIKVSKSTSRFELRVTNNGPEDVTDVLATTEFTIWREGSNFGSSSLGTSQSFGGEDCDRARDQFGNQNHICRLNLLPSGESASLIINHGLPSDGTSMRIEASVSAANLNDPISNNNSVLFSPLIGDTTEVSGGGGGGGAAGVWMLFTLLGLGVLRALNRCIIRRQPIRAEHNNVKPQRISKQEGDTPLADHAAPSLYRRIFPLLRIRQNSTWQFLRGDGWLY